MSRSPRDLATTWPSPSEMDDYHKCPCFWYLRDRLWISARKDKWPLLGGRIIDDVLGSVLTLGMSPCALEKFDILVNKYRPSELDSYFEEYMSSARDALVAWLAKYGSIKENVIAVQPKLTKTKARGKIDYIVRDEMEGLVVRERKLVTGFSNFDEQMEQYELGFQPLCYASCIEEEYGEPVSAVEFDFLFRSTPARGRYKAKEAGAARGQVQVEPWKKDMWRNTAEFTNHCMKTLEFSLGIEDIEGDKHEFNFTELPRHTRNCMQKFGGKVYPCDFYQACKVNMNPLLLTEAFEDGRKEG